MLESRSPENGFTLIELLIVVAILSTLAAIVIPSFSSSQSSANVAAHLTAIKNMQSALDRYNLDHGEYPSKVKLDDVPLCSEGALLITDINSKSVALANQLVMYSDQKGEVCAERKNGAYPYGPYLKQLPINLDCNNAKIGVIYGLAEKVYDRPNHGWGYLPLTGEFALSETCS
jgi:prepilin-type N-terminal cleavage/methylation domain-containing protein